MTPHLFNPFVAKYRDTLARRAAERRKNKRLTLLEIIKFIFK
jgi:hypothetical protein